MLVINKIRNFDVYLSNRGSAMKNAFLCGISVILSITVSLAAPVGAQSVSDARKSVVIIDYQNKQNLKGHISLAMVWGEMFSPPEKYLRGFINLGDAVTRWTKIDVVIEKHMMLSSPRLLEMPFLYITTDNAFELSRTERENVKKYLENGGFLMLENPNPITETSPAEASLKQMLRDVLGSQAKLAPIPKDHPLYTCFWDFTDGPPNGAEIGMFNSSDVSGNSSNTRMSKQVLYLEGIWIKERLAVVYSNKGYIVRWTDMEDNIPQLKMGVNLIVYALRQEGGLAIKQ
jgi:hypothetical protein